MEGRKTLKFSQVKPGQHEFFKKIKELPKSKELLNYLHIQGQTQLRPFEIHQIQISSYLKAFDPETLNLLEGISGYVVLPCYLQKQSQKKIHNSKDTLTIADFQLSVTGKCKYFQSYKIAIYRQIKQQLGITIHRKWIKSLGQEIPGSNKCWKYAYPSIININTQQPPQNIPFYEQINDDPQKHVQSWVIFDNPYDQLIIKRKKLSNQDIGLVVAIIPVETLRPILQIYSYYYSPAPLMTVGHNNNLKKPYPSSKSFSNKYYLEKHCKTQDGSKEVQIKLKQMSKEAIGKFIQVSQDIIANICMNMFGKYVAAVLFSVCNTDQRLRLLQSIEPSFTKIVNINGTTKEIKGLLYYMTTFQEEQIIVHHFRDNFKTIATNKKGNKFLRKLLTRFSFKSIIIITEHLFQYFQELIKDKYGIFVIYDLIPSIGKYEKQYEEACEMKERICRYAGQMPKEQFYQMLTSQEGIYFFKRLFQVFGAKYIPKISLYIIEKFVKISENKNQFQIVLAIFAYNYWSGTEFYDLLAQNLGQQDILVLYGENLSNKQNIHMICLRIFIQGSLMLRGKVYEVLRQEKKKGCYQKWAEKLDNFIFQNEKIEGIWREKLLL